MMNAPDNFAEWRKSYALEIRLYIRKARKSGVVAMSADNMFMVVRIPPNGPLGVNARWVARDNFNRIVANLDAPDRRFVMANN